MDRTKEIQELKDLLESNEALSDRLRGSIKDLIVLHQYHFPADK